MIFEYKFVQLSLENSGNFLTASKFPAKIENELNYLGAMGWELIVYDHGNMVFKRAVSS